MKKHIGTALVAALWLGLSLWAWCKPADPASVSERRPLAQLPDFGSGFAEDFSAYALDQFPLRDSFRGLKAFAANALGQLDNNGIYIADGSAAEMLYPLDEASVDYAVARFNDLYEMYLTDCGNLCFAVVPDKGYYLGRDSGRLTMDYEALFRRLETGLDWAEFVDLTDCLDADSYYRTDTHWRQECLLPAAEKLARALGVTGPGECTAVELDRDFYGVYYGQAALPLAPDRPRYLTWPGIGDCEVYSLDTGATTEIYDLTRLDSPDLYDIFLSGGMAIQTLRNPNAGTDRELIVFRDSFASSLVPLLARDYSAVTLIDTRYIAPSAVGDYVDFSGRDVLMVYSTLILNASGSLRK